MLDKDIVVDENMVILGGNMRYLLKEIGLKEIEVIVADNWTKNKKRNL